MVYGVRDERAVDQDGTQVVEPSTQSWGIYAATFTDPDGNLWMTTSESSASFGSQRRRDTEPGRSLVWECHSCRIDGRSPSLHTAVPRVDAAPDLRPVQSTGGACTLRANMRKPVCPIIECSGLTDRPSTFQSLNRNSLTSISAKVRVSRSVSTVC